MLVIGSNPEAVYPRWRGEHALTVLVPRLRTRFIPAGAGNTNSHLCRIVRFPVYPRWRGEHSRNARRRRDSLGLSPLARGTRWLPPYTEKPQRFIPAGAGNSEATGVVLTVMSVYPRWRGELVGPAVTIYLICGLSPLARGTRDREYMAWDMARFIPAGAGNSESTHRRSCTSAVYPRWRGELAC